MSTKTIDCTPTWRNIVGGMIAVLENEEGSEEAKQVMREEFHRMAQAADKYNDLQRMNQNAIDLIEGK